jgi:hypothetical protein
MVRGLPEAATWDDIEGHDTDYRRQHKGAAGRGRVRVVQTPPSIFSSVVPPYVTCTKARLNGGNADG